ncbi:SPFH domain-containing protein [Parasphaerochaeta coccoides]|uniref:Antifreeze protein type I n=1 Tax=Parasphaerochaeta coccoides (strain ATCC BAA-1237 / DSM 17374 / SPN1) TaxID=760011 RepID=F4GHY5_PARC1|nr:SPFH domain-containing protein [Parasphaerochaeta coccoides]AEC02098.1 antifreeze protein type I [Parasphaerochaeta coccoides DSM 17374]
MKLEIVKFDGLANGNWVIYRYPVTEDVLIGSQLVVGEGQGAIVVKNGKIYDCFRAGSYSLNSDNLPLLRKLVSSIFEKRRVFGFSRTSPFPAEIYFVNITKKLDVAWGTSDPIKVIDPKYKTQLRVRAFGQMGLKIEDFQTFFREVIGELPQDSWVRMDRVIGFYKGLIELKLKTSIANTIIKRQVSALEISTEMETISTDVRLGITQEMEKYGLNVTSFFIKSINFPDEDFAEINEMLKIGAYGQQYAMKRSYDVYETAAGNESGVAGIFASSGVGFAAGMGMGQAMGKNEVLPSPASVEGKKSECPFCKAINLPDAKFCSDCGKSLRSQKCEKCGENVAIGAKFCSYCGNELRGEA